MPTILLSKIYPKGSALKNLRVGSTDVKYVKRGDGKLFYDTLKSTTYSKPSVTLTYPTSNTSAAGGTTSPSSFSYSQSWYYTGHSGNTYPQTNKISGATVEYSISGTGASISSTGVVTWASRGTTHSTSTREATVTVKVTINGQYNTATAIVKQAKNDRTVKGGVTTYGNVTAGSITNATIPASGGTKTATAGNGSQSYSTTRKYYLYDSGSEETISNATSGTNTIAPSHASISATASSLGTTVKSSTTIKSQTVTWTGNGNKSATGTMYIYQAANSVTSTSTTYTVEMDTNPRPEERPIPQTRTELVLEAWALKRTTTTYTSGSVSTSNPTYLTTTVKVYINNVLQTTYTVAAGAAFPIWYCPANTTGQARTIKLVASISESTQTATFENIQLGSSDVYVFQSGWNMIGYSTAASGFTADVGITSTKNGTPQSFAVTSAASWLSGTISQPSGFPYGTHLLTIRASANTGSARSGTITVTQTGSGMTLTFTLTQQGV